MNDAAHLTAVAATLAAFGVDTSGGPDACWTYLGELHPTRYVRIYLAGEQTTGNRVAWTLAHGRLPRGIVYRTCQGGARCLNPRHLSLRPPRSRNLHVLRDLRRPAMAGLSVRRITRRLGPTPMVMEERWAAAR